MRIPPNVIERLVLALLDTDARKAVYYVAPDAVVKATRQRKPDKRAKRTTIILTFGAPAFPERRVIKRFQRDGTSFPVPKVQLRPYLKQPN